MYTTTALADHQLEKGTDVRPGLAPNHGASPAIPGVAKVVVPHREYWLFRGPLPSISSTDAAQAHLGQREQPAFVWPADHAWCFAQDVDPHWAGIGGSSPMIHQLIADPRLDVVAADPTEQQPFYR
ncbi:hypothetical protein O7626_23215 [Micromonospora sp. WMMD1102]|uniref:hypothetical protein n=1 Tax=Micromonospora sp. WMMD1102 TaxID=3016105 RepID=UPI00241558A9|nr:hypothetical protein [Micromonospora sp. WMMD1102]MDG4788799.1 hypothetical protein [Micromonospora sp. WMMD1102]